MYFVCKLITDLHNSIHVITGLNHMHKIRFGKKIGGSVRVLQKFLVRSFSSPYIYNNHFIIVCSNLLFAKDIIL